MRFLLDIQSLFIYYFTVGTIFRIDTDIAVNAIGAWLSLVERCVRDAEVACSNHVAPIIAKKLRFFHFSRDLGFFVL